MTACKNAHSQKWLRAECFVSLVEDLKSYFPGFFLNTKTMEDQNEISDTPVENEEATYNTLEASVDKEQPLRKSKGSSKTTDKRRRTSSSSADSASGDESSKSDSNGEVILTAQVALTQILSVKNLHTRQSTWAMPTTGVLTREHRLVRSLS